MILVEVYVPAVDERFDFELDENAKISRIVGDLCEILSKKMKNPLPDKTDSFMLCSLDQNTTLPDQSTLCQCRIGDGGRLLLV
ncbi:MAG TPA: hypothetical protein DF613_09750 [Lachnospiraceae bacterium]|nr:hypothetical protein [Lachnospiraceae bacterium]